MSTELVNPQCYSLLSFLFVSLAMVPLDCQNRALTQHCAPLCPPHRMKLSKLTAERGSEPVDPGSQFMALEEVITPANWTLTMCQDFRNEQTVVFRDSTDRR